MHAKQSFRPCAGLVNAAHVPVAVAAASKVWSQCMKRNHTPINTPHGEHGHGS